MEKNIAILIADLSGYTALTETHGPLGAADLIDTYLGIVKRSLAGESYLHEHTGDEVMIVSDSADHLLATARNLVENTSQENRFLQVHGGLHYGSVMRRRDKLFGTAINMTARIASKADPGSIWCSGEYVHALGRNAPVVHEKGRIQFKNIRGESEVFEIIAEFNRRHPVDPVCKMLILDTEKAVRHPQDEEILFCDETCLDIYMESLT